MSVPARHVPVPEVRPVPRPAAPPRTPTARRAPAPRQRPRRVHAGFLILCGVVVSALIVGVVALNALLAQAAFATRATQTRLDDLRREQIQLTDEAARRSSPVLVATWARRHDMVIPAAGDVHILRVLGSAR